jgi:hypothetical protein
MFVISKVSVKISSYNFSLNFILNQVSHILEKEYVDFRKSLVILNQPELSLVTNICQKFK